MYAETLEKCGFDLNKSYFELSSSDVSRLKEISRDLHFTSRSVLHSPACAFWNAAKMGRE